VLFERAVKKSMVVVSLEFAVKFLFEDRKERGSVNFTKE
jgi:hypothetical protein